MAHKTDESNALESQPAWLHSYIDSPEKLRRLYKRTLFIVVLSQIFGGAGLAAGITVGALLAQDMLGTDSFAGVPTALFTLGSAGAALLVGRLSQRFGRRLGLATGFLAGGIGAIGVVIAALTNNILLLFASLLIYGAGTATNLQARYAGTDLANSTQRATAVSIAMVSTTFGAVAGPNLVDVMGQFATVNWCTCISRSIHSSSCRVHRCRFSTFSFTSSRSARCCESHGKCTAYRGK